MTLAGLQVLFILMSENFLWVVQTTETSVHTERTFL